MNIPELQRGNAAEHLVIADLLLREECSGAFLANQGSPFDLIAVFGGQLYRIQVKSTGRKRSFVRKKEPFRSQSDLYRFSTRRGCPGRSAPADPKACDVYALVALDTKKIAYLRVADITSSKTGRVKQCLEFRDSATYQGRTYSNGTVRKLNWARMFDAYATFPLESL